MLVDPRTNLPFYVGKGKYYRVNHHYSKVKNGGTTHNFHKDNIIKKLISLDLKPITKILHKDLDEETAYLLETKVITFYGIESNGGILTNCDYGGRRGATNFGPNNGMFGKKHTDESKAKMSQALTGLQLGKTYEEIYGESEAKRLKEDRSVKLQKPKSNEHKIKCKENFIKGSIKRGEQMIGKTLEELHGKDKAEEIKRKSSEYHSVLRVEYQLSKDSEQIIFIGRPPVLEFLNTNISTFARRLKDGKPINGWIIVKL
jgi:hypothetical protein